MNISSITNKAGQVFNKVAESGFIKKQLQKGLEDPAKFAATMMVTSIVSKDAINCVLYTSQSLNNQKIPEDKRKFVAALDLMNGIINVGGQILAFKLLERNVIPKIAGKSFLGMFKNKDTGEEKYISTTAHLAPDNIAEVTQKIIKEKGLKPGSVNANEVIGKVIKQIGHGSTRYKAIESGLLIILSSLATMAFVKRTLAPLIATPMAGWLKENFMDNKPKTKKDRMYYEVANIATKYDNKIDKTAFSSVSSRQS